MFNFHWPGRSTRLAPRAERTPQESPGVAQLRGILGAWGMEIGYTPISRDPGGMRESSLMGAVRQALLEGCGATIAESPSSMAWRLTITSGDAQCVIDIADWRVADRMRACISETCRIHEMSLGVAG